MLKKLTIIFGLIFILIGCSSEEQKVINKFKVEGKGEYSIVIFNDKSISGEMQSSINNDLIDANKLWGVIQSVYYIILDENSSHDYDYKEALSLDKFPEIMVFDDKGMVLRTNKVQELEELFLHQN